jgi:hypothetical protein
MRCYFMRQGHIAAVEFLSATDDLGRIEEARQLFESNGQKFQADGFEVWDGAGSSIVIQKLPHSQTVEGPSLRRSTRSGWTPGSSRYGIASGLRA